MPGQFLIIELEAMDVRDSHSSEMSVLFTRILMLPAAMWIVGALMHLGSP